MSENNKRRNCVIYCRVSSAKQAQQGESLEDQEKICLNISEQRNLQVEKIFKEQFSGRKERPVVEEIITFIKKSPRKVDYLIFRAIDRFSRAGVLGYEELKAQLAKLGVELIDANGIIQPSKNTLEHLGLEYDWSITRPSEIAELVMAQQGKNEVNQILTRMIGQEINLVREGYKVRQADDGFINQRIFVEGKKRMIQVPDPQRAHFYIQMFNMRASGAYTDQQIVDHVNAMGYRSRTQKMWSRSKDKILGERGGGVLNVKQLQRIIQRPIYCGIITERWVKQPTKAQYEGLISIETFNRANRNKLLIEEKSDGSIVILKDYNPHQLKRMKDNPLFPFKSIVRCPECKKPFLGSSPKGKMKSIPTYHCARNHKYFGVNKKELESKLSNYVEEIKHKDNGFMKALEATLVHKYREKEKELGEFSLKVGVTVAELETEKLQKIKSFTSTDNKIIQTQLEKEINELHERIEKTRKERNGIEIEENDVHNFVRFVKSMMEHPIEYLIKQENISLLRAFYGLVFEELPTYSEIINGTHKLSLPYKLNDEFRDNKSLAVTSRRIELRFNP